MNSSNITNHSHGLATSLLALPACQTGDGDADWFPAVDLTETPSEYVFEVDLPGLKPEEIDLRVDSDRLSIQGRRAKTPANGKRLRAERPAGAFVRHLPLPQDAQGDIRATFGNGVLELRVPRARPGPNPARTQMAACEAAEVAA